MRYEFLLILCLIYRLTPLAASPPKVLKRLRNGGWRREKRRRGKEFALAPLAEKRRERERERMAMSHDLP